MTDQQAIAQRRVRAVDSTKYGRLEKKKKFLVNFDS